MIQYILIHSFKLRRRVNQLVRKEGIGLLKRERFRIAFERFTRTLTKPIKMAYAPKDNAPYTHRLDLDRDFLDFSRLSANIPRIHLEDVWILKEKLDEELEKFRKDLP